MFGGTPQLVLDPRLVPDLDDVELILKVETLNPIRSFKGRGAEELVRRLGTGNQPLVCASAGNFGQGLAYAAQASGRAVHVFAAEGANALKVERMRRLGAEVRIGGADFDGAKERARAYADSCGARFVEDGREPAISEGAGAIAVELLRASAPLDAIFVPVGNGGLIAGIAHWVAATAPTTRVIGVCAAGAPAMQRSFHACAPISAPARTIADGIAVRVPVPEALDDISGVVHDVVLVDDARIVASMQLIHRVLGLAIEPAGAVGFAALIERGHELAGTRVATVLCGSNLAPDDVRKWLPT